MATETDTPQAAAEDTQSKALVDTKDGASLKRWADALGVTTEALEGAVLQVGPRVDKIKDYLAAGMAADQEGG